MSAQSFTRITLLLAAFVSMDNAVATVIPTVTLQATPTSIATNGSTTLTWSSTNATSCTVKASSGTLSPIQISGSDAFSGITANTKYTVSCKSVTGKTATKSVTVNVVPVPTVKLKFIPASVPYNGNSYLLWSSTHADSCAASDGWSGATAISGELKVSALTANGTYTLTCTGVGGTTVESANIKVGPPPPTVTLTPSATTVAYNGSATLAWSSTNATSCTASGSWKGIEATSGSVTLSALTSKKTYTLVCTGAGGKGTQSASISIAPVGSYLASAKLGVNLSWLSDWSGRDLLFIDVMKQSRGFATVSNYWDPTDYPVPVGADGWPTTDFGVLFISSAADPLGRPLTQTYPSMFGTYTLSFTGTATLNSNGGNTISNIAYDAVTNTTTAQVTVTASNAQLDVEFTNTNGGVKNLQLLRPGYALGTTQVFTNEFLNVIAPFSTLRLKDLLRTDGNPVTSWAGRTPASQPTQNDPRGVAWEYLIELANVTGKDIWINIPEGVDLTDTSTNNYVTQLATLLEANLTNPKVHVYVEYSNELWNTAKPFNIQTQANLNSAISDVSNGADSTLIYDNITNQFYWGIRRAAHQVVRISQLFANVFGTAAINTTIRPVFMSQYGVPSYAGDALTYIAKNFGQPSNFIYGVGGAPYFYSTTTSTDVNGVVSSLGSSLNTQLSGFNGAIAYTGVNKVNYQSYANYYGIQNMSYEASPDMTNIQPSLALTAAADPRMGQMIQAYLADAIGCGNDLSVYYHLSGAPGSDVFQMYNDITVPTDISQAVSTVSATLVSSYNVCTALVNSSLLVQ